MRPAIWLFVCLILVVAVSLIFTQSIATLQQQNADDDKKEGLWFLAYPALKLVDVGLNNSCRNKMNDKANGYAARNANSSERDVCNGPMFQHYPADDETVKRWPDSKRNQINNAFSRAGVNFITSGDDVDFLLNFFKKPKSEGGLGFDILTYPYGDNMNPFYELVNNMKKANVTSFKQYLEMSNQVTVNGFTNIEGYSGAMTNLGCYNDKPDNVAGTRAMEFVGNVTETSTVSAANQCADKAVEKNSGVFGLQWKQGNQSQCFIGSGAPDEVAKATSFGKSSTDCTQPAVPLQNNVFVIPKTQIFDKQQTFAAYGGRPDLQKQFGINPADYTAVMQKKADIDKALQKEGLTAMPISGATDAKKYAGVSDRERGMATTWNTFNTSDDGKDAVNGCKKVCDGDANCGAFVLQKRVPGPWDCWTIPYSNLNASNAKKDNPAQVTYYKLKDNVSCAADANCKFSEPFQEGIDKQYVTKLNGGYAGHDISYVQNKTLSDCKTTCNNMANCAAFSFDHRNTGASGTGDCYFKDANYNDGKNYSPYQGLDTYIVQTGVSPSSPPVTKSTFPTSTQTTAQLTAVKAGAQIPASNKLGIGKFNDALSSVNNNIKITNAANMLNQLKSNGVNLQQEGFQEGINSQIKSISDSAAAMGAKRDTDMNQIMTQIKGRFNDPNAIVIINAFGIKMNTLSSSLNALSTFGINTNDSLNKYYTASNGALKSVGIRPDMTTITAMNNFGLKYSDAVVNTSAFVSKMQGFGFNAQSDFAGILNAMSSFGLNFSNLNEFRTNTGMKNINELSDYIASMKSYGIMKYDTNGDHAEILRVANKFADDFKAEFPNPPSLKFIQRVLKYLTNAEIPNITTYKNFRDMMKSNFASFDDAAFRFALTQFSGFKNRGSDNGGKFRRTEIERIVNTLNGCGAKMSSSKNVTFQQLIDTMYNDGMRLYVAGDQTNKWMPFDKDPCAFMRTFGGNQSNFGPDKQGFTTREGWSLTNMFRSAPEPFTNAHSISSSFSITNPVQAVPTFGPGPSPAMSKPDFYSQISSFGINSVDKYNDMVKIFNAFGTSKDHFCEVVEKLKAFGVPRTEYVSFVKALTGIQVTYPYFNGFINTIMDFGVYYNKPAPPIEQNKAPNLYYSFMNALKAFGLVFTVPTNGTNTFYRFLASMKSNNMAISYPNNSSPCKTQPDNAFFHAMNTFVALGYTIDTFFETAPTGGKVNAMDMINAIKPYDCQLRDFTTPHLFNSLKNSNQPPVMLAENMQKPDPYMTYFSNRFVGRVQNTKAFVPNTIFSFMFDADFDNHHKNKVALPAQTYRSISESMKTYIQNTFMDGKKVKDGKTNEYEALNLNMNTLRLFPNFMSGYILDTITNGRNPYYNNYTDRNQDTNPVRQRGCTRYIKVKTDVTKCPEYTKQT